MFQTKRIRVSAFLEEARASVLVSKVAIGDPIISIKLKSRPE